MRSKGTQHTNVSTQINICERHHHAAHSYIVVLLKPDPLRGVSWLSGAPNSNRTITTASHCFPAFACVPFVDLFFPSCCFMSGYRPPVNLLCLYFRHVQRVEWLVFLRSEANQALVRVRNHRRNFISIADNKDGNPRLFMEYFLTFSKQICGGK